MKTFLAWIKSNYFFVIAFLIVIFLYYFYIFSSNNRKLCINSRCFFVELAVSAAQRETGLMGREFMLADRGMFFIFEEEGEYSFWMKNMKIPLDMVFMDKNLKILSVAKNLEPCRGDFCSLIKAEGKVLYVLEINAGAAEKAGIKKGQEAVYF